MLQKWGGQITVTLRQNILTQFFPQTFSERLCTSFALARKRAWNVFIVTFDYVWFVGVNRRANQGK